MQVFGRLGLGVFALSLVLIGLQAGCYQAERDLVHDPANTPLIHILSAAYESERGVVSIQWEYLGNRPVERFVVLRRSEASSSFSEIGTVGGGELLSPKQRVASFRDTGPVSGEQMDYRVFADNVGGGRVGTRPVGVVIPGAQMRGILKDPPTGSVQVVWRGDSEGAAAYEVLRWAQGGPPEVIHRTENVRGTSYLDRDLRGNITYTYSIRTRMSNGAVLNSSEVAARLYGLVLKADADVLPATGGRVRLASGSRAAGALLLTLAGHGDEILLDQIRYEMGRWQDGSFRVYRFRDSSVPLDIGPVASASLSVAGPSALGDPPAFPTVFVGGINARSGEVVLRGYSLPQMELNWKGHQAAWPAEGANGRVAMALDPDGRLFVGVGRTLKVFSRDHAEVGSWTFEVGEAGDLLAGRRTLWAAFPDEGRLLRGRVRFSGAHLQGIDWEDVGLAPNAWPVALTGNSGGQVFALDAGNRLVRVLDPDGNRVLEWEVPEGDFLHGDLSVDASGGNLIHVSDSSGSIYSFLP